MRQLTDNDGKTALDYAKAYGKAEAAAALEAWIAEHPRGGRPEPEPVAVSKEPAERLQSHSLEEISVDAWEENDGYIQWRFTVIPEHCEERELIKRFSDVKEFHSQVITEAKHYGDTGGIQGTTTLGGGGGAQQPVRISPEHLFKGKLPDQPFFEGEQQAFLTKRQGQLQTYFNEFVEWERMLGGASVEVMAFP